MSYQSLTTRATADHRRQYAEARSVAHRAVREARAARPADPALHPRQRLIATATRLLRCLPARPGAMATSPTVAR